MYIRSVTRGWPRTTCSPIETLGFRWHPNCPTATQCWIELDRFSRIKVDPSWALCITITRSPLTQKALNQPPLAWTAITLLVYRLLRRSREMPIWPIQLKIKYTSLFSCSCVSISGLCTKHYCQYHIPSIYWAEPQQGFHSPRRKLYSSTGNSLIILYSGHVDATRRSGFDPCELDFTTFLSPCAPRTVSICSPKT